MATVTAAVLLQTGLARFTVGGHWVFDLVLVAVVFAGLQWGPTAGVLAGSAGGIAEDLLSGGVMGVSGLAMTLMGFAAGAIGTQFVLTRPGGRTLVLIVASLGNRLITLALYGVIDQHWPGVLWTAMLTEIGLNALAGLILFQGTTGLPGLLSRRRSQRWPSVRRR